MAIELTMPKNGMDMTEGTIVRWLKNEGDHVDRDEPIMEIETDKITMESEAPAEGYLLKKLYEDGAVVPVLTVIGYLGEKGEEVPDAPAAPVVEAKKEEAPAPAAVPVAEAPAAAPVAATVVSGDGIAATPMAKRLAAEKGIDLASIKPSGKHGEIVAADVEGGKAAPKASMLAARIAADQGIDLTQITGSGFGGKILKNDLTGASSVDAVMQEIDAVIERHKMSGMRKVIAQRMSQSHAEVPPVTQNTKVDVTDLIALRAQINNGLDKSDKISLNDILIKAVSRALCSHERMRMQLDGDEFVMIDKINVSMAVSVDGGLVVPVIRDADRKSLYEISRDAKDLASRAREGKLLPDEMKGGVITISNLGMYGIHSFTPIINQPEASIIGACEVEDELALVDGEVCVRKKMILSLTYDHRVMNGAEAAEFAMTLKELLEHPLSILI